MWPFVVVTPPPPFVNGRGLRQAVKHLSIETFVAQLAVEALPVGILPGTTPLYVARFHLSLLQPALNGFGEESRAATERSVETLIRRLDDRLRFGRNYETGLRPYAAYCEEEIWVE